MLDSVADLGGEGAMPLSPVKISHKKMFSCYHDPSSSPNVTNNMLDSVADLGGEGAMPPSPVKISHKKDGHRRRLHIVHVSRPHLPGCWFPSCKFYDKSCKANSCTKTNKLCSIVACFFMDT